MNDALAAEPLARLEAVLPVVRAILMRKSGMTLAPDDTRPDNIDALDLFQDVVARLWERFAADDGEVLDPRGYAARVAYNAWSDHLRERYPERASLKNSLRYFLGHQPRYAVWEGVEGATLAGPRAWQIGGRAAAGQRLDTLRIAAGAVARKPRDRYSASDWDRLLAAVFDAAGGPIEIDELVGVVARVLGVTEARRVEPRASPEDDDAEEAQIAADAPTPAELAELREQLALLWQRIVALRVEWRQPYLLNPPAADGGRAEIDVFVAHGIARLADLERATELAAAQYAIAWRTLLLSEADREELALLATPIERFAMLYKYLPLADTLIGELMGLAAQQVVNRRNLATASLRKSMSAPR